MQTITFKVSEPDAKLSGIVDCFRIASYKGDEAIAVKVCPNGRPGIVVALQDCIASIDTPAGSLTSLPPLFLYGQVTEPSVMRFKPGPFTTVQVLLRADALQLFTDDASTLTNNFLSATDLHVTRHRLRNANTDEIIRFLSEFLQTRPPVTYDPLSRAAIEYIDQSANRTVAQLADALHTSERTLEYHFKRAVGISPLLYSRIRRFHAAMRLMDTGTYERMSDVAHALDFHDESHFIRDIKIFSGKTPRGITQKVSEFYHDQVGTAFL